MLGACTKKEALSNLAVESQFDQGRSVYMANCIACHNTDPRLTGAIGPELYGSSFELIEAKVLRNEYPAGYGPKRSTKLMIPFPGFKDKISSIYEFLNK